MVNVLETSLLESAPSGPLLGVSIFALGSFTWWIGLLEPAVAAYALRLYRSLGHRVGWWLCAVFGLLAVGRLLPFWGVTAKVLGPAVSFDLVALVVPLLLLIGMAHTESILGARLRMEHQAQQLRRDSESQAQDRLRALVQEKEDLRMRVARYAERERALEATAQQYCALFTENPQPMWVFDLRSLQVLAVNEAALRQYGFTTEAFLAQSAQHLLAAEAAEAFLQDAARPAPHGQSRGVWRHCRRDGTAFEVEVRVIDLTYAGCPARLVLTSAPAPAPHAAAAGSPEQKMELLGQVAGRLAQHFGPLLKVIATEAERLLGSSQPAEAGESLQHIAAAANRAAATTEQLLTAGAQRSLQKERLDLNRFLQQLEPRLRRLLGAAIVVEKQLGVELPGITADAALLEQVLVNLLTNARAAMAGRGTLSLKTATVSRPERPDPGTGRPGEFVCLSVRDSGCGLSPEVQSHLFEPFFTTGAAGEALGLGLASTYGAVTQLEGWLEVATEAGAGTEFKIFLPACPAPACPAAAPAAKPAQATTILLVEPDPRMRLMARTALEWNGYKVVETDSAAVALMIWPGQVSKIALVLVDLGLAGEISGLELAERLRKAKPGLKVLFTCQPDKAGPGLKQLKAQDLVAKPFTSADLLSQVDECLADKA